MFFSSVVSFMLWSVSWLFNHLVSETIMFRLKAAGLAEEMDINWCVFCLADGSDWCQQRFCECDRAAIDCMTQSSYNSSLRGLAASMCSATNHTGNLIRGETARQPVDLHSDALFPPLSSWPRVSLCTVNREVVDRTSNIFLSIFPINLCFQNIFVKCFRDMVCHFCHSLTLFWRSGWSNQTLRYLRELCWKYWA